MLGGIGGRRRRGRQRMRWLDGITDSMDVNLSELLKLGLSAVVRASQVALVVKNLPANAGDRSDTGLIPGSGRLP